MNGPRVLIIAGSDSGGGAGIQADIKTVSALGGWGMTAITAITAQNTLGVQAVHPVPLEMVEAQFRSAANDLGLDAVKTGMLHSAELVELAARLVDGLGAPVVVDPVMAAKGGDTLLAENAAAALREKLFPAASLVTPNLDEAEILLGQTIRDPGQMAEAARALVGLGAKAALVKGGHLEHQPCDVLFDGQRIFEFSGPRIETKNTHGTGCTLASACATLLGKGFDLPGAVERARLLVRRAILGSWPIGKGHGPVDSMADLTPRLSLGGGLSRMQSALDRLEAVPGLGRLVPEVRSQIAFALPMADSPAEVIGVSGRITSINGRMRAAGAPRPGASSHIAKVVLTAASYDPGKRAAMALRFDDRTLSRARELGYTVGEFSRDEEPADVKAKEGSSLEWGTGWVIENLGMVPDLIFDRGESGKEPVIRLLAAGPEEIVQKVLALAGVEEKS